MKCAEPDVAEWKLDANALAEPDAVAKNLPLFHFPPAFEVGLELTMQAIATTGQPRSTYLIQ